MDAILLSVLLGFFGAVVRVLVFSGRSFSEYGRLSGLALMMYSFVVVSCGIFSGIIMGYSVPLSFLAGYGGVDLMDGYYKAFKKGKVKLE